jgi:GNAT superfamily N-acetyltransferase
MLLFDEKNHCIGRIAAFVNQKTVNLGNEQPTGGVGFFECINRQEAANALFDAAREWLLSRGMEAMDGPINFGDRDRWWGLHVEGDLQPNYGMFYHLGYYKELFENYGFGLYFKQYTYLRKIENNLNPKVYEKGERVFNNPDYRFEHLKMSEMEKYALDFLEIYNKAWAKHLGVGRMRKEQAVGIFKAMKPIADPTIVWFGYYKDAPVAFYIMIPELNQIFRHFDGKFGAWEKLKFLYYKWRGEIKKIFGVIFGVVPEHQGKGVEAAIVVAYSKLALVPSYRYNCMEFNWIGDFNPAMMRVCEDVGGSICKVHHTYRFLFDREKEFKRMPIIDKKHKE